MLRTSDLVNMNSCLTELYTNLIQFLRDAEEELSTVRLDEEDLRRKLQYNHHCKLQGLYTRTFIAICTAVYVNKYGLHLLYTVKVLYVKSDISKPLFVLSCVFVHV